MLFLKLKKRKVGIESSVKPCMDLRLRITSMTSSSLSVRFYPSRSSFKFLTVIDLSNVNTIELSCWKLNWLIYFRVNTSCHKVLSVAPELLALLLPSVYLRLLRCLFLPDSSVLSNKKKIGRSTMLTKFSRPVFELTFVKRSLTPSTWRKMPMLS